MRETKNHWVQESFPENFFDGTKLPLVVYPSPHNNIWYQFAILAICKITKSRYFCAVSRYSATDSLWNSGLMVNFCCS